MRTTRTARRALATRTSTRTTRTVAVAIVAAGAVTLAGCGGSDDGKGTDTDTPASKAPAATVQLPKLDGEKIEVAAVWTGPEQENFTKVLTEFEKRTGASVTFVPAQDPIVNFLGTKIMRRQSARRGDAAAGRRDPAGRGEEVGQAGRRGGEGPAREELRPGLAGPRRGRRHPVRRVLQGRQQVAGLVQQRRVRERGRHGPHDLEGLPDDRRDDLGLGSHPGVGRRMRTAGRSPTGSRTSTSPRRARRSTTSSRSTRSSGPTARCGTR